MKVFWSMVLLDQLCVLEFSLLDFQRYFQNIDWFNCSNGMSSWYTRHTNYTNVLALAVLPYVSLQLLTLQNLKGRFSHDDWYDLLPSTERGIETHENAHSWQYLSYHYYEWCLLLHEDFRHKFPIDSSFALRIAETWRVSQCLWEEYDAI
jgi:hypothetical protein